MGITSHFIPLPESHVASLAQNESGYWWCEGRVHWAKRLLQSHLTQNHGQPPQTYCDLGCGTGGFAQNFSKDFSFTHTLLVDADPKVLALAQQNLKAETKIIDFNVPFTLPLSPDVVTCMDVLEHIEHEAPFLNQIAGSLPTNGILIASVPAIPAFYSEWDKLLGHHRRYTKDQFRALLEDSGFTVRKISYMWSFLSPMAPFRRLKKSAYQKEMAFEKVPGWLNRTLFSLSKLEYLFSKAKSPWIGTSLIALATKD